MYLVRCEKSGVFVGDIETRENREVHFKTCIRLWYWSGAASVSQIAMSGVKNPDNCKFSVETKNHKILDAIEIIEMTDEAVKSVKSVKPWVM